MGIPEAARKRELATRVVSAFPAKLGREISVCRRGFASGTQKDVDSRSAVAYCYSNSSFTNKTLKKTN